MVAVALLTYGVVVWTLFGVVVVRQACVAFELFEVLVLFVLLLLC